MPVFGLGTNAAAALLIAIRDNPERHKSESCFARLCGVAPIPASSGKVHRHRLNRGGVRKANAALRTAVIVRLRSSEKTRAYTERRTQQGLSKMEIIRLILNPQNRHFSMLSSHYVLFCF
ncbi:transposase [Ferrimicrobium acidiphilum]|uniref:transposase n=1 Tax=Ferrimicrobium acidiphilum TaxID=121039 RepID=UPI003C6CC75B